MIVFSGGRLLKRSLPLYSVFKKTSIASPCKLKFNPLSFNQKPPRSIVIVDFETTGASSDSSIREVGAVKVDKSGNILEYYHALVTPKEGNNLGEYAKLMISTKVVFQDIVNFCYGSYIVAHNAGFDRRFLMQIYQKYPTFSALDPKDILCTYRLACKIFPSQESYKLSSLAKSLNLCYPSTLKSHRAIDDVFKTKLLWDKITNYLDERGVSSQYQQECLFNIQNFHKDLTEEIINYYADKCKYKNNNKKHR